MKKLKNGFSILEVMITFVIISIVSITAFSVFETSNKSIVASVYEKQASIYLINALEVYKYYDNYSDVYAEMGIATQDVGEDGYAVKQFGSYTVKLRAKDENGDYVFHGWYEKDEKLFEITPYKKGGIMTNETTQE